MTLKAHEGKLGDIGGATGMVEAAGSLKPESVGAGVADASDVADGAVRAADGATFSGSNAKGNGFAAPTVVDITWSGESSSVGGIGVA
jgi:hypothetical protein